MFRKGRIRLFSVLISGLMLYFLSGFPTGLYAQPGVTRLNNNRPLINWNMPSTGWNINGPSIIEIPGWIQPGDKASPEAEFYLYFSSHNDSHIKMAWSEQIEGPYTIFQPDTGVFHLDLYTSPAHLIISDHIASPDVIIDNINERIILYFHAGILEWEEKKIPGQSTVVAISDNGLDFNNGLQDAIICPFYARIFEYNNSFYALSKEGMYKAGRNENLWTQDEKIKSLNPYHWKKLCDPFSWIPKTARHFGLLRSDDILHVVYSRYPSIPEHIEYSFIDLSINEHLWMASKPISILFPEHPWEGIGFPCKYSSAGPANRVQELRDPDLFQSEDGEIYMLYTGGGEEGIGIANIDGLPTDTKELKNANCKCESKFTIYPNPITTGKIQIEGIEEKAHYELLNGYGKTVISKHITDHSSGTIDLGKIPEGYYFLHIQDESCDCWYKIIKEL